MEWFDAGLDQVSAEILVRPLDNTDGRELLARYDVRDPADVDQLLAWARGYPLALTVGANLLSTPPASPTPSNGRLGAAASGDGLDDLILARLGGRKSPMSTPTSSMWRAWHRPSTPGCSPPCSRAVRRDRG